MVEDTDGGAYPYGAAVGDQLFGLGVLVIFRFFDRAVVYHPEEATQQRSPYPSVVKKSADRGVGISIDAWTEKCHESCCGEFLKL